MLSWNINGLNRLKKDDPECVQFLSNVDLYSCMKHRLQLTVT